MKNSIGCVLSAAAITMCMATGVAKADPLTVAEVRDLFPGRYMVNVMGVYQVDVVMRANGTAAGSAGGERDAGHWSIESGKLCIQWNHWNNGRKDCSALHREGDRVLGRGFWFRLA